VHSPITPPTDCSWSRRWGEAPWGELQPVRRLAGYRKLGAALARLHSVPVQLADRFRRLEPSRLQQAARLVGWARPELAAASDVLSQVLVARYRPDGEPPVCLHGDVNSRNWLLQDERVALIDLDQVAMGPAAADLGGALGRSDLPRNHERTGPPLRFGRWARPLWRRLRGHSSAAGQRRPAVAYRRRVAGRTRAARRHPVPGRWACGISNNSLPPPRSCSRHPTMSENPRVTHGRRLAALESDSAALAALSRIGERRHWWDPATTWVRTYGRFTPGRSPFATLVFEAQLPRQQLVHVEVSADRPLATGETAAYDCDETLGWLRSPGSRPIVPLPDLPQCSPIRAMSAWSATAQAGDAPCGLPTVKSPATRRSSRRMPGARLFEESQWLWRATLAGEFGFVVAKPDCWDGETRTLWHHEVAGVPVLAELRAGRRPSWYSGSAGPRRRSPARRSSRAWSSMTPGRWSAPGSM